MSTTQSETVTVATRPPSQAVVERVAAREGVDHTELVPLYEAIDPDALDGLIETSGRDDPVLQIGFTYHGYDVTVTGDGGVHLTTGGDIER